jgi:beta-glucanase (GH16 family)
VVRVRAVIAVGLITLSLAACQESYQPLPTGDSLGQWRLRFDDEFNGRSLNASYWSAGWFSKGITQPVQSVERQCYNPANVKLSDGALVLSLVWQVNWCGGKERAYASGMVNTNGKFAFTYGFMEARIWLPGRGPQIANWPVFWADGQNWPEDGEIDVVEGLGGRACWHFIYSQGNPGGCAMGEFTNGWHTFGADWEPGSITYYYDGRVVGMVDSGVTSAPMYLILNNGIADGIGGPALIPAAMRVAYVRVWQHTQ